MIKYKLDTNPAKLWDSLNALINNKQLKTTAFEQWEVVGCVDVYENDVDVNTLYVKAKIRLEYSEGFGIVVMDKEYNDATFYAIDINHWNDNYWFWFYETLARNWHEATCPKFPAWSFAATYLPPVDNDQCSWHGMHVGSHEGIPMTIKALEQENSAIMERWDYITETMEVSFENGVAVQLFEADTNYNEAAIQHLKDMDKSILICMKTAKDCLTGFAIGTPD